MNKVTKIALAGFAAVGVALGGVTNSAFAANSFVQGALDTSGSIVQYDYTRTHTFTGPITLNVTDLPYGYLRLGLRNMGAAGGPQFTETRQWNYTGVKQWGDILQGTRFAMQGRMKACGWGCDNYWGGYLTY